MLLSLVIPVMNEEANIAPMLEQIDTALKSYKYEVIFVDDGSTDTTVQLASEIDNSIIIEQGINKGKGAAVRAYNKPHGIVFAVILYPEIMTAIGQCAVLLFIMSVATIARTRKI